MKLIKNFEMTAEEKAAFDSFIDALEGMDDDELYDAFSREVLGVSFNEIDLYERLREFRRKYYS